MQFFLILTALLALTPGTKEDKPAIEIPVPPLEIRLVVPEDTPGAVKYSNEKETVFLAPIVIIDHSHVRQATPFLSFQNYSVSIRLNKEGGEIMRKFTGEHRGERLAIVVGGNLQSAPRIQGAFGAEFQITGNFNAKEAHSLAESIVSKPKKALGEEKKSKKPAEDKAANDEKEK